RAESSADPRRARSTAVAMSRTAAETPAPQTTTGDSRAPVERPTAIHARPQAVASAGVTRPRVQTAVAMPMSAAAPDSAAPAASQPANAPTPQVPIHADTFATVATHTQPR